MKKLILKNFKKHTQKLVNLKNEIINDLRLNFKLEILSWKAFFNQDNIVQICLLNFAYWFFFSDGYKVFQKILNWFIYIRRKQKRKKDIFKIADILDQESSLWANEKENENDLEILIGPFLRGTALPFGEVLRQNLRLGLGSYKLVEISLLNNELELFNSFNMDLREFYLNLRNVIFSSSSLNDFYNSYINSEYKKELDISLEFKGPGVITAANIKGLPEYIKVVNPNQFLTSNSHFTNLRFRCKLAYRLDVKETFKETILKKETHEILNIINLQSIHNPVIFANFEIITKLIKKDNGLKEYEFLKFKIQTNGSISALESLYLACLFAHIS